MGLFAISDDSKVKMFNVAAAALGREDAVVERGVWRRVAKFLTDGIGKFVCCTPKRGERFITCIFFPCFHSYCVVIGGAKIIWLYTLIKRNFGKNPLTVFSHCPLFWWGNNWKHRLSEYCKESSSDHHYHEEDEDDNDEAFDENEDKDEFDNDKGPG